MAASTMAVSGTYTKGDGTAHTGSVKFVANSPRFLSGGVVCRQYPIVVTITAGAISAALVRNGSAGAAGGYTVTELIDGAPPYTYQLADQAGPVDLSTLS